MISFLILPSSHEKLFLIDEFTTSYKTSNKLAEKQLRTEKIIYSFN